MKREFAINIGLLLIANLFIKAFYLLGIDRQMQLAVGTETYGLYYNLLNVTLLFQFINDFGIQNFTNRYVSQNRESIQHQYKDFAGLKMILSVFYILAVFAFAWIMDYKTEMYPFIFHLSFNQILISGIFFVRSTISGLGYYKTDSFFSVLDRILLILLGSFLLWHPCFRNYISIDAFVWIQTISLSITILAAIYFIKRRQLSFSFGAIEYSELKKILSACLPFATIYLFSTLYNKLDVLLIGKLLKDGNQESGIYAASMRLFEACSMISLAFGSLLLAMFSSLHLESKKLLDLFKMAMNSLVVITLIIVMATSFYSKEIINLLYHQTDSYWTEIFRLTMLAFVPASLNYIFGAFLAAVHKENKLLLFYSIASLISLSINLWLIIHWKVIGAAYAAIATHTILFIIQYLYIRKEKLLELRIIFWQKILLFILLSIGISYGFQNLPVAWIIKLSLSCTFIILLAFLMKMASIKNLMEAKMKVNQD